MYIAEGNCVYYLNPDGSARELFLTIHPTNSTKTPEEQAHILARKLNEWK